MCPRVTESSPDAPQELPSRGLCVPANQTLGRGRGKGRPAEPSGSFPPRPGPAEHRDPRGPEARRPGRPAEPEGGRAEPGRLWPVSGCVALAERSRLRGAVLSVPAVPDSSTVKVRAGKPGSAEPVGDRMGHTAVHLHSKEPRHGQA